MISLASLASLVLQPGIAIPLRQHRHQPRTRTQIVAREVVPTDGNMSSGSSDSSVTFGDLLVNVVRRQQLRMPAADQMQAFEATIDSMLDRGSADLANVFDELSVNLTKAEGNTSRLLSTNLADAQALIAQVGRLPDDLPGRQEVIDELMALRKAQLERDAHGSTSSRCAPNKTVIGGSIASGGSMVSLLNGSARWMGVLMLDCRLPGRPLGCRGADRQRCLHQHA